MTPREIIASIPSHVKLIAVSKLHSKEEIEELAKLGCDTFGENRVQELKQKYDPKYHWHMIGQLQRNKVKDVLPYVDMIQSVDRLSLVQEIEKQCVKLQKEIDVLIEVNISREAQKGGIKSEQCLDFLKTVMTFPHIHVKGLMCVGPLCDDEAKIHSCFMEMHHLYQQAKQLNPHIDTLSMGMSDDYHIAIECGANMIRLGTILFGERDYSK